MKHFNSIPTVTIRFLFVIFFLIPHIVFSQNPTWVNYTNIDDITSIASYNGTLWIGARGGVVRFDPKTMSKTIFTGADGLVTNDVFGLAVDSDGRVWAGGQAGNNGFGVYDGSSWTTVGSDIPKINIPIKNLVISDDGTVYYISYSGDLIKYKDNNTQTVDKGILYPFVFAISSSNKIWVVQNTGVKYFNGTSWTQIDSSNSGLGSNSVSNIVADHFGRVWFSTAQGISMFDGVSWHDYKGMISGNPMDKLELLTVDSKRNLWLKSSWGFPFKILRFDGNQWQVFDSTSFSLPQYSHISSSCADSLGNVYFGLAPVLMTQSDLAFRGGGQILTFDGIQWKILDVHSGTLPYSPVYNFGLGRDGQVWMGTNSNGAVEKNGNIWRTFDSQNNGIYPSNQVNGFAFDASGGLWIVGYGWNVSGSTMGKYHFEGGTSYFDGTKWVTYNLTTGNFPTDNVEKVAVDNSGNVWFASSDKGVIKFNGSTWTTYDTLNCAFPSNVVNGIVVDNQNNIWFGTDKGVAKFDGVNWTVRNSQNSGLPYDFIRSMAIDRAGRIWFLVWNQVNYSTVGEYVVNYDGSAWNSWDAPRKATCMCIDSSNSVWIGSYGLGINKFNDGSWSQFTTENSGIGYNYIEGIMADKYGNIWCGAQDYGGGVSVYNPNGVTGVKQFVQLPSNYILSQNYPNPFNPNTTINYSIANPGFVTVKIFNILGEEIGQLVNEYKNTGSYSVNFDASKLSSGIYFYSLSSGSFVQTKKMIILK